MRIETLALLLIAGAGAACAVDPSAAGTPTFDSTLPLVWVDPARCLPSCTHTDEPDLVTVDASARLASDGAYQLRADVQPALAALIAAAGSVSMLVEIGSAHRTYEEQGMLWDQLSTTEPGRAARPGHSEHEAGLAVDLGFEPEAAGDWTAANAWRYGFVLSYPQYKQKTTGFRFEPWHFRFVGSAVAADLHDRPGLTLEEWFRLSPGRGVSGDCSDCTMPGSYAGCDGLSVDGVCNATVLTWCFDGVATAVDCAVSDLVCAGDPSGAGADCR